MPARSALLRVTRAAPAAAPEPVPETKTRLFHARMLVTRVEEWCVEAETEAQDFSLTAPAIAVLRVKAFRSRSTAFLTTEVVSLFLHLGQDELCRGKYNALGCVRSAINVMTIPQRQDG